MNAYALIFAYTPCVQPVIAGEEVLMFGRLVTLLESAVIPGGRSVLLVGSVECKDCDVLGYNNYIIFGNNRQFSRSIICCLPA